MNPFKTLDRAADRLAESFPLFDRSYDQSHLHHALICALAGGFLGMALFGIFTGPSLYLFTRPLAVGILGGIVAYIVRELLARLSLGWGYERWDGAMDVLVPVWILAPWALAALFATVPWWTGLALYVSAAAVALGYTVARPAGKFLYAAEAVRTAAALLRDSGYEWGRRGDAFIATDYLRAADTLDALAGPRKVKRGTFATEPAATARG